MAPLGSPEQDVYGGGAHCAAIFVEKDSNRVIIVIVVDNFMMKNLMVFFYVKIHLIWCKITL